MPSSSHKNLSNQTASSSHKTLSNQTASSSHKTLSNQTFELFPSWYMLMAIVLFSLTSFCLSLRSEWSLVVVSMATGGLNMTVLYTSELACRKQLFPVVIIVSVFNFF